MENNIEDSSLYKRITSKRNIFTAIFSMESYIFEKGLLDTELPAYDSENRSDIINLSDMELYYALADKYNVELIDKVIHACQKTLKGIFSDNSNLFSVKVYFKLKSFDDNKLKYRPMHTARLIDLFCMVSILNCLMFEDDNEEFKRSLSDLSRLIPHNFYGNIPSTDTQYLFHKWQNKYKEYTENVIEHCRAYQKNHKYLTEVCLDIKNFFPSVPPQLLYNYIIDKLRSTYEKDLEVLKMAVAKLLFLKLDERNIEPWKNFYYSEDFVTPSNGLYMNCGIPQGLPQSYFFGNLCMIEVKKILMKEACFKGDSYFYVDDSVIYVQAGINANDFENRINNLNEILQKKCNKEVNEPSDLGDYLSSEYLQFQKNLNYQINFHEKGKSVFAPIDSADNQFGPIANLARETSMSSNLYWNLDEIDDQVSLKKLNALDAVVSREIKRLKKKTEKNNPNKNYVSSKLKHLCRFKKYFLYRQRVLKISEDGGLVEDELAKFKKRFLEKANNLNDWFEQNDEEIFQSEYRLLIQKASMNDATELVKNIIEFEKEVLKTGEIDEVSRYNSFYFTKDASASLVIKAYSKESYTSLIRWARINFSGQKGLGTDNQMMKFRAFLKNNTENEKSEKDTTNNHHEGFFSIYDMMKVGFENRDYTLFVLNTSAEYKRKILNVYFSEIMSVLPSDALTFTKSNARKFRYTEVRILAYLRNRDFDLENFEEFVEHLDEKDIANNMGIDMGLLGVLNLFIVQVRKPEWVDCLILTHRLTKGLWYNGSKFLNSYTLHNEEHAVTLINKSLELTNRIDYFTLKNVDYYILFLACYLHDISMVIHPDLGRLSSDDGKNLDVISDMMMKMKKAVEEFVKIDPTDDKNSHMKNAGKFLVDIFNKVYEYFEGEVRDFHATESAQFIRDRSNTILNFLEPTLISFVAKVSESHGYGVMDVYGLKSRAKEDTVSLKYLMILIRLADLLDVTNDRVNYHLLRQNLKNLSLTSKFHWISHLVTDKIELNTDYEVEENKDIAIDKKPISEIINFDLYLNYQQLTTATLNEKCKCCQCNLNPGSINIEILSNNVGGQRCTQEICTVLCRWMMKKHEWLVPELVALNDYLYSVNNSLFKTKIYFNIHYRSDMNLDPDMFDYVQEYLKI